MTTTNKETNMNHTVDLYKAAVVLWEVMLEWAKLRPAHNPISIPEIAVLDDYELTYGTQIRETVIGSFCETLASITIVEDLHGHQLMTTLLHELVHLVQYNDNKYNFSRHYELMDERFGYDNNPYEVEARASFAIYHNYLVRNREFRDKVWAVLGRD